MPRGLYVSSVLAALLVLQLTLLWWTGLQVLPSYLGSGIIPLLRSLPVDARTLRRVALLLLVRLFDAPALACLIVTPIAVGIALGSPLAAILVVPGVLGAVVLAVALSLVTGRFFLRRVQGAPGGLGPTLLRWAYLVLWAVPAFTMYGFLAIAPGVLRYIAGLALVGPASLLTGVYAIFPFPFAALPALGANLGVGGAYTFSPIPVAIALGAYAAGLVFVGVWLMDGPPEARLGRPPWRPGDGPNGDRAHGRGPRSGRPAEGPQDRVPEPGVRAPHPASAPRCGRPGPLDVHRGPPGGERPLDRRSARWSRPPSSQPSLARRSSPSK